MPVSSAFGIRVVLAMILPPVTCVRHEDTGHEPNVTPEPDTRARQPTRGRRRGTPADESWIYSVELGARRVIGIEVRASASPSRDDGRHSGGCAINSAIASSAVSSCTQPPAIPTRRQSRCVTDLRTLVDWTTVAVDHDDALTIEDWQHRLLRR